MGGEVCRCILEGLRGFGWDRENVHYSLQGGPRPVSAGSALSLPTLGRGWRFVLSKRQKQ